MPRLTKRARLMKEKWASGQKTPEDLDVVSVLSVPSVSASSLTTTDPCDLWKNSHKTLKNSDKTLKNSDKTLNNSDKTLKSSQPLNSAVKNAPEPDVKCLSSANKSDCEFTQVTSASEVQHQSSHVASVTKCELQYICHQAVPATTPSVPARSVLHGTFSQGHAQFGVNANKQCVANSLAAVMFHEIKSSLNWSEDDVNDVDTVLFEGNKLYSKIKNAGNISGASGYLFVAELPQSYTMNGTTFAIEVGPSYTGCVDMTEEADAELMDIEMPFDLAIQRALSEHDACFVTVRSNTCVLIRQGNYFTVFDPHARNSQGLLDARSDKAVVIHHSGFIDAYKHLSDLAHQLTADVTSEWGKCFEVTGVKVQVNGQEGVTVGDKCPRNGGVSMKQIQCKPSSQTAGNAAVKTQTDTVKPLYSEILKHKHKVCHATVSGRNPGGHDVFKKTMCNPSTQPQSVATVNTNTATEKPLYSQVLRGKRKVSDDTHILRNECLSKDEVKSRPHIDESNSKKQCLGVMEKADKYGSSNNSPALMNERENIKSNLSSDEVTVISESEGSNFHFCPLTIQQQKKLCVKLNIFHSNENISWKEPVLMNDPCETKTIEDDGNCFFRALSYVISGNENSHRKIRLAVVKHMEENSSVYIHSLRHGFSSVEDYLKKSRMKYVGVWATEMEIQAAADLLGVHIFTYSRHRWLKYCTSQQQSNEDRAIYLKHCNECHYEAVTCVNVKNSEVCTSLCKKYSTSKFSGVSNRRKLERQKKLYETNMPLRNDKVQRACQRYHEDVQYREMKRKLRTDKYENDEQYREKQLKLSKEKYENDKQYKEKKIKFSKEKYDNDPQHRQEKILKGKEKYETDPLHREKTITLSKEKYSSNEQHQKNVREYSKRKYATDEQYQKNVREYSKQKYATDEQYQKNVREYSKQKYATDEQHQKNVREYSKRKYATDEQYQKNLREYSKQKYATDEQHQRNVRQYSVRRYKTDKFHAENLRVQNVERRMKTHKSRQDMDFVTEQFRHKISTGPEYVCSVCHRQLFQHQVIKCKKEEYAKKGIQVSSISSKCITETYLHICSHTCLQECIFKEGPKSDLWICFTCHRKILAGKIPEESIVNNLALDPIPSQLNSLNSVEQHLIAIHIPFMKMLALPKGGQNGVHGPVTCVPSNITSVTNVLPRPENHDLTIRVKLKRKLTYKGHYEYQYVHTDKIQEALAYLKRYNKWYKDVEFNNEWINPLSKCEEDANNDDDDDDADDADVTSKHVCKDNIQNADNQLEDETSDASLYDRQQHGMFMDTCLQPVDIAQEVLDQHFDDILSVAPAEGNNPVRLLTDETNEAKCFPVLFPKAKGTFHDSRQEKLTLSRYLNTRILNADGRFAKNLDYIFYGQYLSEINQVVSNVSIALRKGYQTDKNTTITSEMLTNTDSLKSMLNFDEGYKFLRPIRGTPAFWQSVQKDLFAMVRQLGIPTWFCSFSSADLRWPEVLQSIMKQEAQQKCINDLDWSDRCGMLKRNPVTAARMFDYRFHCFLKDVIMSPAQPIGKIVDYFYRVEFQQRGSPHTHCLFWVENAPQIDKNDDDEIAAFVDQYVTCEMPPETDEEMYEIVSTVQQHSKRHSKTCKKKGTICRFNFPRPPSKKTFITRCNPDEKPDKKCNNDQCVENKRCETCIKEKQRKEKYKCPEMRRDLADAIMKQVKELILNCETEFESVDSLFSSIGITQEIFETAYKKLTKKTSIVLKRKASDIWVNQYNRDLLRCWNANMDIQYVVDAYSCIVYIISYISKAEREMGLLLQRTHKEASNEANMDAKQALKKLGSVYLFNREISAQESVYRLTNMRLKEGSRKVAFIPTGDHTVRMSLPLSVLQKKTGCADAMKGNIWMTSITERYKGRPTTDDFPDMCLASFVSQYRVLSKSESSGPNSIKLKNDLGFIQKRTRSEFAVVRYVRLSATKNPEKYYQTVLQLFLPHYFDCELKPSQYCSFEEFYERGWVKTMNNEVLAVKFVVESNRSLFEKDADKIEKAQEDLEMNGPMEDVWAEICPEAELERLECLESITDQKIESEDMDKIIPDLQPNKDKCTVEENHSQMQKSDAVCLLRSLNEQQSQVFYKIRHWCLQKIQGENPDPFHVFISGGAGTGKSHLIKAICYETSRILSKLSDNPDDKHVLLTAPTGVAAYNINAATIHNSFSIGTDATLPYQPLGEEKINTLRTKLGHLQILIIDEISMVDHKMLAYIHGRLRQIKQTGDYSPFGKVSIIAVGDFYQLPPVKGKALYTEPKGLNLWANHFALTELTNIVRQKDPQFAQLLNRLRKHQKKQELQKQDVSMLKQCETGEGEDSDDIHIYATNSEVDDHNSHMLNKKCDDIFTIEAQDFEKIAKTGRLERKHGHHAQVFDTCLQRSISIGVNARVMLLKNIAVTDGLVNGAFGTVSKLCFEDDETFPSRVYITFDNEKVGQTARCKKPCLEPGLQNATPIEPDEERVTKSGGIRRQFPLKLAWACTVHKVQGLTVQKAVVSLKKIFAPGQAYVALSRVTSLKGLVIEDFNESAIYSKDTIETSMQNMPAFIEPLKEAPIPSCKIILHNVEGLSSHVADIKKDNRYMEADIICVTETWLKPNHCDDTHLNGFIFHSKERHDAYDLSEPYFAELKEQQHGGVGVYYKEKVQCTIEDLPCINIECIVFNIPHLNADIAVLYRPPSCSLSRFKNNLSNLITHMNNKTQGKIILGDFNENLLVTKSLANYMQQFGFTQVVVGPTTENATLIDHVYIKDIEIEKITVHIMPTYFSCHECVVLNFLF